VVSRLVSADFQLVVALPLTILPCLPSTRPAVNTLTSTSLLTVVVSEVEGATLPCALLSCLCCNISLLIYLWIVRFSLAAIPIEVIGIHKSKLS